jgi:mycothiol synthase
VEAIWRASQDADDPAFRPRGGWWSLGAWATASRLLLEGDEAVGVAAVSCETGSDAAEARLALLPSARSGRAGARLLDAALDLAGEEGAPAVRLYAPAVAMWATGAARERGFRLLRAQHLMLRPADAPPMRPRPVEGVRVRPLRAGEEPRLLEALNRGWEGTWNYRPLTADALAADLAGQREGFLVAEADRRLVGTVHALLDARGRNPDGGPYAWVSNLTTDPDWRGRGLGRALLAAGLESLRARGAGSVALGVDGGAVVPLALYRSAGFRTVSEVEIWERAVPRPHAPSPRAARDAEATARTSAADR